MHLIDDLPMNSPSASFPCSFVVVVWVLGQGEGDSNDQNLLLDLPNSPAFGTRIWLHLR